MRTIAIAVGSMLIAASVPAFAQDHGRNEPYRAVADQEKECWNSGAGHFERVRPGERQGDLDFNRCRFLGEETRDARRWNSGSQECWNSHAGHFEAMRSGERQDDLDLSRCRNTRDTQQRMAARECWNQGAGHYEAVRSGERQDDLDFSRCR